MLFRQQLEDAVECGLQLRQFGFNTFPDLRRFHLAAIDFQRMVKVIDHTVVIHDVTGIFAGQGAVHPCDGLQQGVFF